MGSGDETDIQYAARAAIKWLKTQKPDAVKDLSRSIQALSLWNENTSDLIEILLSKRKNAFWDTDRPIPDTARAYSALAGCGIIHPETINWILKQQKNDNWNNNEIDTSYALIALGDAGIKNEQGCEWLYRNYGEKWEYAGTTSLIITALIKQNHSRYREFIKDRAGWLISKRQSGGWAYTATSNLVIQALILAGEEDINPSIQWLLDKQEGGNWGDIISTSLSLISLKMYLSKK
ncbi:hypothetical protein ANME2D_03327 [Candidatus Methanoperedens nitroreducens]|uniref:Squalene cyclase C-terminal domain-containing protein n=1 Tax=Candidatus Methanoperedens nitratireducens TaxID=1392998 RepID=A0A062UZ40_9EURY|nr:hypothetical protein [Candidatus Methanoperedens nitroreducens]KCZ70412.1 hypothetical protein ANME2D_03327 [Candidatus Methanoperedens nitroreducens]MDJ1420850.1 hypothetical protein [Candidatus Methanoperedens sp.]